MELKRVFFYAVFVHIPLLIELYGIETDASYEGRRCGSLLIELYGIETPVPCGYGRPHELLIELYGIETITDIAAGTKKISSFNRTIWN